jgi:16S rRNA (adenine1518-N6/adenine1519-N6)-dimethyltransferase
MNLEQRAKNFRKQHSLGQNFLTSEKILNQIIAASKISKEDVIIEIGPGIGFLTELIIPKCKELYSIELDRNTIPYLKLLKAVNKNFHYLRDDCLALSIEDVLSLNTYEQKKKSFIEESDNDEEELGIEIEDTEMITEQEKADSIKLLNDLKVNNKKLKIVANIPYQITSKILVHLLGDIGDLNPNRELLSEINILVQKEFADRLCAKPGTKDYGSMTLLVQYWAEVTREVDVPRESFSPAPRVDSTFIKIKLRDKPLVDVANPKQLRRFVKAIFANRRKKLLNGLKAAGYHETELEKLNLPENLRGETLTLEQINQYISKL